MQAWLLAICSVFMTITAAVCAFSVIRLSKIANDLQGSQDQIAWLQQAMRHHSERETAV